MKSEILVVDDESDICDLISGILEDEGYDVRVARTVSEAELALNERAPGLVVLDVWLRDSEMDGLQFLGKIKGADVDIPVIMISGHGTFEMAVSATKLGAQDFLQKPFKSDALLHSIERALNEAHILRENQELRHSVGSDLVPDLSSESPLSQELHERILGLVDSPSRLFIWGEDGVGKETVARFIHHSSERSGGRLCIFNCSSVSEQDFESKLLGLEVDGQIVHVGALESSHNGILVLESVHGIPLDFQSRLARIVHSGVFRRAGGSRDVEVNVRIITTSIFSPQDLEKRGVLQSDLYNRLNVQEVHVPPLRSRREDIEPLFRRFVKLRAASMRCIEPEIESGVIGYLQAYDWVGNLRQLKSVAERLLMVSRDIDGGISLNQVEACLRGEQFFSTDDSDESQGFNYLMNDDLRAARNSFEKEYLRFHLMRFDGNIARTAQFVGMDRASLHRKLKSLELL